jgi:4'-phosphopantetheinyl transferase
MPERLSPAHFNKVNHIEQVVPGLYQGDELHIWKLDLNAAPADALKSLSKAEHQRYSRIIVQEQQQRFIASRFWLRRIIGSYLRQPMHEVRFLTGEKGKPSIEGNGKRLEFNLSHTGEDAVLAIAANTPVGIDMERSREKIDVLKIARHILHASEIDRLEKLTGQLQTNEFFECWTRMEARQKCLGLGIFNEKVQADQVITRTWSLENGLVLSAAWADTKWQPELRLLAAPGN